MYQMFAYDAAANSWAARRQVPSTPWSQAALGSDGRIYFVVLTASDYWWVAYDPASDNWARRANMLNPRSATVAAGKDGRIYAISGGGPEETIVEVYDPAKDEWSNVISSPAPYRVLQITTGLDGRIYALGDYIPGGGIDGNGRTTAEVFDPTTAKWTAISPLSRVRGGPAFARGPDGRLYAMGGLAWGDAYTLSTVEAYDPATDRWSPAESLITPRGVGSATLGADNSIYLVGGVAGGQATFDAVITAERYSAGLHTAIAGVSNATSDDPTFFPGSLVSIYGLDLAPTEATAQGFPLPKELNETMVTVNGIPVPLLYVAPAQVNFFLPFDVGATPPKVVVTSRGVVSADFVATAFRTQAATVPADAPAGIAVPITISMGGLVSNTVYIEVAP